MESTGALGDRSLFVSSGDSALLASFANLGDRPGVESSPRLPGGRVTPTTSPGEPGCPTRDDAAVDAAVSVGDGDWRSCWPGMEG